MSFCVVDIAKEKLRKTGKVYKILDSELAVHSPRQRS